VRPGRVRGRKRLVHAERGGATAVSLATDFELDRLPRTQVETRAVSVRVDPQKLATGTYQAT